MPRKLIILLLFTGCAGTHHSLDLERQQYPEFSIGHWYSSNIYTFEDSIVYQRGWTDGTGMSGRFKAFTWERNDSIVNLTPITRFYRNKYRDGLSFRLYSKSARMQLLIPLDSVNSFKMELKTEFDSIVSNYKFIPTEEEQHMIGLDSAHVYLQFEKEAFTKTIRPLSDQVEKLGIWSGSGFK
ncbi:hypothetical protein [Ekhidna sp.]